MALKLRSAQAPSALESSSHPRHDVCDGEPGPSNGKLGPCVENLELLLLPFSRIDPTPIRSRRVANTCSKGRFWSKEVFFNLGVFFTGPQQIVVFLWFPTNSGFPFGYPFKPAKKGTLEKNAASLQPTSVPRSMHLASAEPLSHLR